MDTRILESHINSKRLEIMDNPFLSELEFIRNNFLTYNLHLVDNFAWRLMNDYANTICFGWTSKVQQGKIAELIEKYGSNSLFWEYLAENLEEREFYKKRLAYLVYSIQKYLIENSKVQVSCRILRKFISVAHTFHRRLFMHPLTEKQKAYMFRIERVVGIYYNDLSPEENGEMWESNK